MAILAFMAIMAIFLIRVVGVNSCLTGFLTSNHAHDAVSLQPEKPSGLNADG
jgi:hypothetical protein